MDAPRILQKPTILEQHHQKSTIYLYSLTCSFQHHVLPSLVENVMKPTKQYGCDYFVHFFIASLCVKCLPLEEDGIHLFCFENQAAMKSR
jgi:hypothetical protein